MIGVAVLHAAPYLTAVFAGAAVADVDVCRAAYGSIGVFEQQHIPVAQLLY